MCRGWRASAAAAAAGAAVVALGGCASQFPMPQATALQSACTGQPQCRGGNLLPPQAAVELDRTPFFPQQPLHCGPAALATVLHVAGRPVTPEHLAERTFTPGKGGTLADEMLSAAWREQALAVQLPPRLDAVLDEVAAGHPVVVLQNLSLPVYPQWHYAVVVGYDLPAGTVTLRSGTTERLVRPLSTFERTWARGEHWAIAVVPPGQLPLRATRERAVEAAVGFERSATPAQSSDVYRSILARWPGDETAQMGLGNARHAAGDLAGAEASFADVARRTDGAAAWNNLAMTRLERGDRAGALRAARRAVERARADEGQRRWLDAAQATLAQVQSASR